MPVGTKIATCCYCGTRAALTLKGDVSHELACSSCGAPLHDLKQMPVQTKKVEKKQHWEKPHYANKPTKSKKSKKKKKSWGARLLDELDLDDVLDIFD